MYAIVDDATYSNVKGDEKSVGVLKFDKDPSKEFPGYKGVEASQLVKLKVKQKALRNSQSFFLFIMSNLLHIRATSLRLT